MKLLNCPLNGPRNISEFSYGGEYHAMPDHENCSAQEWAEYVFFHENKAGNVIEWWCHTPSSYWFLAERNTITDKVLRTMTFAEFKQQNDASGDQGEAGDE